MGHYVRPFAHHGTLDHLPVNLSGLSFVAVEAALHAHDFGAQLHLLLPALELQHDLKYQ